MAEDDASRWDARYQQKVPSFQVDSLLLRHQSLLSPGLRSLDVACGTGHNSLWLAEAGLEATALDISQVGLNLLSAEAEVRGLEITTICADLDTWQWPSQAFDAVLVFRYLDRSIFASLKDCVRPGGLVFYQTFGPGKLELTPGFNPAYVLGPGELAEQFSEFEMIEYDEADGAFASIVARRTLPAC